MSEAPQIRHGVRLGVDVGSVRVGVAASDPDGRLAMPVETIRRDTEASADGSRPPDLRRLAGLVRELGAIEVVVGLPRSLDGTEGAAAGAARAYAEMITGAVGNVTVRLVDERLSTVSAHRDLREAGRPGRRQRGVVDQAAAVTILQAALDAERSQGAPRGEVVSGPGARKGRRMRGRK